ncbi:hypothetical protein ACIRQQ_12875 [Streptomyces fuscichromogenes]|uniref:hypothetical protein n=1 Tax=Streptomyces fuscichromogenes TaxID=1324013 RepID=UPI00381107F4
MPATLERARRGDTRIAVNGVPALASFTRVLPEAVACTTRQFPRNAESRHSSSEPAAGDDPGGEA